MILPLPPPSFVLPFVFVLSLGLGFGTGSDSHVSDVRVMCWKLRVGRSCVSVVAESGFMMVDMCWMLRGFVFAFTVVSWVYVVLGCGKFGLFFMCICVSYVKVGFFLQVHMGVKSMQDVAFSRWPMCI